MRKTLFLAFAFASINLIFFCFADTLLQGIYLDQFLGLNTFLDTSKIEDNEAQVAKNVLTDHGYLEKRTGNIRVIQLLSGFPARYLKQFIDNDSNATRYLITHASNTIYRTDFSGAPVSISTTNTLYETDSVSAFGREYFVNGNDVSFYWDGVVSGTIAGFPTAKFIEFADERLYVANSTNSDSEVRVSSYGADSGWSVPSKILADSPNQFTFQKNDGEPITCFKSTPYGKFVGKRSSSYVLKGYDNNTYYKRLIDPSIGCVDDRSVQMVNGLVVWAALGGVYAWDGANPPVKVSLSIEPLYLSIRQLSNLPKSWTVTDAAGFGFGSTVTTNGTTLSWDSTTISGSIFPSQFTGVHTSSADFAKGSFPTLSTTNINNSLTLGVATAGFINSGFEDGTIGEAITNWNQTDGGGFTVISTGSGLGSYVLQFNSCLTVNSDQVAVRWYDGTTNKLLAERDFSVQNIDMTTFTFNFASIGSTSVYIRMSLSGSSGYIDKITSPKFAVNNISTFSHVTAFGQRSTCNGANQRLFLFDMREGSQYYGDNTSVFTSTSFDTRMNQTKWGPFQVTTQTFPAATISWSLQSSPDNLTWTSVPVVPGTIPTGLPNERYVRYQANFAQTTNATTTARIDDVTISVYSTGAYSSAVNYVGTAISTWSTFNVTDAQLPIGRIQYQIRANASNFDNTSSTIPWTAITNHQNITIATNAYVQWQASTTIQSTTETVRIDDVSIGWIEGTGKPMASAVKDNRYYLSVTTSLNDTNNDAVLVWQKNKSWVIFNGPSYYSMGLYGADNQIYAGDSSTNSYVWKTLQPGIYHDDGFPIDSQWTTKDFTFGAPSNIKKLTDLWIEADYSSGTHLNVGYAADKNSVIISSAVNLYRSTTSINTRVPVVDGFANGRYFKFNFMNAEKDQYFRIHALNGFYTLQPLRRPDDQ